MTHAVNLQAPITISDLEKEAAIDIDEVDDSECSPLHIAILKGGSLYCSLELQTLLQEVIKIIQHSFRLAHMLSLHAM